MFLCLKKFIFISSLLKNKDMESVNLDMEDIFEEEAADDDFPSVGPLPDLPDGEEGAAEGEDEGTYTFLIIYSHS